MRSKGSHFRGSLGLRVFSADVVQPFATGLHLFFFRPPRPPLLQDPFPCHCCTKFHGNSHGYCDAHRLARFYHNAFSRCHLVPWIQTDLLSWLAFVMMQHSSFERAENRKYVATGPHVCNMLCNVVEVVAHRPTGSNQPQTNSFDSAGIALWGFSICRAADDFLCTSHGWYRIEGLAGLDCHLFAARAWITMLCQWPVTFHYHMYVVTCFHMVLHMTIADSCRYPVLWMSLDRLAGGSATSICVVLISLLFASVSYALLRFDRMHRATLELSLASEAICSQAPDSSNPNMANIWNRRKWGVPENHPEIGCFRLLIARLPGGTAVHRTNLSSNESSNSLSENLVYSFKLSK